MVDHAQARSRYLRDLITLTTLFAVVMVLTNVIGTKLFLLFPEWLPSGFGSLTNAGFVVLTTGIITYPLTFLLTDVVSEVYGAKRANHMVVLGFVSSIVMLLVLNLGVGLPRADRFWVDPSGNFQHGSDILSVADDQREIVLDSQHHLLQPVAHANGTTTELLLGVPTFGANHAYGEPNPVRFQRYHTTTRMPERWDQRGPVTLAAEQDLAGFAAGAQVVPAVRVLAQVPVVVAEPIAVELEYLAGLPPSGSLLTGDGALLDYTILDPTANTVTLSLNWMMGARLGLESVALADGQPLALAVQAQPADMQYAYESAFAAPGILLFASMLAYLVAQLLDVSLFHFWKRVTKGRFLWLRNNGSTAVSQLVDTIIVNGIFLPVAFGMDFGATVSVIVAVYLCKLALAVLDTPLIYLGVWFAKRRLGYAMHETVPDLLALDGVAGQGAGDAISPADQDTPRG